VGLINQRTWKKRKELGPNLVWNAFIHSFVHSYRQITRPIQQYGSSEAISSITWFGAHAGLLGAGMGIKWIRIYDVRGMEGDGN
jgi:hypothetical protein